MSFQNRSLVKKLALTLFKALNKNRTELYLIDWKMLPGLKLKLPIFQMAVEGQFVRGHLRLHRFSMRFSTDIMRVTYTLIHRFSTYKQHDCRCPWEKMSVCAATKSQNLGAGQCQTQKASIQIGIVCEDWGGGGGQDESKRAGYCCTQDVGVDIVYTRRADCLTTGET